MGPFVGTLGRSLSVQDLEQARQELKRWEDRFDRYDGNNPNKYRSDINSARSRVQLIELSLRAQGLIPPESRPLGELRG
jgi:hypothetical protein